MKLSIDAVRDKIDWIVRATFPLLVLLLSWVYSQHTTLETRFYELQRETVSKSELREFKQDLLEAQEKQYQDILSRIELIIKAQK